MKLNIKAYIVLASVFVLSIGTFFLIPDGHEVITRAASGLAFC